MDYKGIPQRTGTYPVKFILSDKGESRDNYRLRVSPGDTIYVEYHDYTLPKPHTINDRKKIVATATVEDQIFDKKELLKAETEIIDIDGNPLHHCIHGEKAIIKTNISNLDKIPISATIITTIKNSDGIIQNISFSTVMIAPSDTTSVKSEWEMKKGEHAFEIFVWDNLSNARPMTDVFVSII